MANIYDKAYEFAAALVKEESYINFKQLSNKINNSPAKFEKIKDHCFIEELKKNFFPMKNIKNSIKAPSAGFISKL